MTAGRLKYPSAPRGARRHLPSGLCSRAARSSCSPRRARRSAPASGWSRPRRPWPSSPTWAPRRSARGRAPRRDPCPRVAPAASAPARPACDRRHRTRVVERDPARGQLSPYALSKDLKPDEVQPLPTRFSPSWPVASSFASAGRTTSDLPSPHQARRAVLRVRDADRARRLRGAHDLLLPGVPDRRAGAEGPEAVAPAAVKRIARVALVLALVGCGSGANEHFTVESRLVGRSLERAVFVPSGDTKGRPLLLLLHGRSRSPDSMAKESITDAIDELGSRAPVVVFANGGNHSYYHDRADGRWGSYILDGVIPAAVRKYDWTAGALRSAALDGRLRGARSRAIPPFLRSRRTLRGDVEDRRRDASRRLRPCRGLRAKRRHRAGDRESAPVRRRQGLDRHRNEDPFRSANEELARRLAGESFHLWRGDHDFSHFERDAPKVMRFYANALEGC